MVSGKLDKRSKADRVQTEKHKRLSVVPNRAKTNPKSKLKKIKANKTSENNDDVKTKNENYKISSVQPPTASQQLHFFLNQYQSANDVQLSSLELESISEACILKLSESMAQEASILSDHMKASFGPSWREVLCKKQVPEGKFEPGSPALVTISLSALRSLELLRGLRPLTRECQAAKLFSKHMKVEDQVSLLKNHVNIACGTPSRIKKLIEIEALGLSRLAVVVLDMQTDVKGYSLFTLRQVRDEFWDLYKTYFHQRLLQGHLRICLYGTIPVDADVKKKVAI